MASDGQARRREGRINRPHREHDGGKRRPRGGLPRLALMLAAMLAAEASPGTPEDFAAFIVREVPKWQAMAKLAGVKGE